jgi:tetratricopeptide (TPR) repeat protein
MEFLDGADYPATTLLAIADALLGGEIALADGRQSEAIASFLFAVTVQDDLPYMEPPFWYYPARQSLGLALMQAGRYIEAEQVYRSDLVDYPHNGWSAFGLMQSLEAQGREDEARAARSMFEMIWMMADVTLTSSRI